MKKQYEEVAVGGSKALSSECNFRVQEWMKMFQSWEQNEFDRF